MEYLSLVFLSTSPAVEIDGSLLSQSSASVCSAAGVCITSIAFMGDLW